MQLWHLLKEVITYHRLGRWRRCFCGERRCFWPHTCSCLCLPAGLFWWWDYGQPWRKNWGRSPGWQYLRFSATPPEKTVQRWEFTALWMPGFHLTEEKKKRSCEVFLFGRSHTHTKRPNVDVKLKGSHLHCADFAVHYPLSAVLTWCMFDLCGCWSMSEQDRDLCSLPLCRSQNWCYSFSVVLRLTRLFSCSHSTLCRLQSNYSKVPLLLLLRRLQRHT